MKAITILVIIMLVLVGLPGIASAGWMDSPTKPTVTDWSLMASNITSKTGNATTVMSNGADALGYNLTTAYTQVVLNGGQSLNFTIPATGSYLVLANIRENTTISELSAAGIFSEYALCDANNTAVVANSERMGTQLAGLPNYTALSKTFTWIYTNTTGTSQVGVCGKISSAVGGQWSVDSNADGRSTLSYIRLP